MTTANVIPITPPPAPPPIALNGVNVMLLGPTGSGKTTAIGTLVDAGVEVFYLDLDNSLESLLGYYKDRPKPLAIPDNLHWHSISAPDANFANHLKRAQDINRLSLKALADMQDPKRMEHNQFVKILEALNNFPDDRTGQKFGSVDSWTPERALVVDGLTGISNASMSMVVGNKPVKSQGDFGLAMEEVYKLVFALCNNCKCHYIQIAHTEREIDPTFGGSKITVSTLGNKLAPRLSPLFSDVILAVRDGTTWKWDTANTQADLKTRNLPYRSDLPPNFGHIISKWKARQA